MEHVLAEPEPLCTPVGQVDGQVNAQLYHVLVMLVDSAMRKARCAPVWSFFGEECVTRQRRRFQAMLSAILRVQLRAPHGEALDIFERQIKA